MDQSEVPSNVTPTPSVSKESTVSFTEETQSTSHKGDHVLLGNIRANNLLKAIFQKSCDRTTADKTNKANSETDIDESINKEHVPLSLISSVNAEENIDSTPSTINGGHNHPQHTGVKSITSKPSLISSDTVILSQATTSQPQSPEPRSQTESVSEDTTSTFHRHDHGRDTSIVLSKKPFSLLSNISDRQVSLSEITATVDKGDVSQQAISHNSSPQFNVVGNIPQSILDILAKQQKQSSTMTMCSVHHSNQSQSSTACESKKLDSEIVSGKVCSKPYNVKNSDTIILESDDEAMETNTQFSNSSPSNPDIPMSIPLSALLSSSSGNSFNDIFLHLGNQGTPMLRCQSGDLLDISNLLKIGPLIDTNQASSSSSSSGLHFKRMLPKEIQTAITLGTNNIDLQIKEPNISTQNLIVGTTAACVQSSASNTSATIVSKKTNSPSSSLSPQSCARNSETADFHLQTTSEGHSQDESLELPQKDTGNTERFKCDLCNATFTRIGNYKRHRKIHNLQPETQSLYKCSDCGRDFLQRCDLKRHLLIHAKKEPHRCEKCGKGYIRRSDLVVHMRFHNKDRAFQCSLCDKKFFQSGDLKRHERRAHRPQSQLTCGHCEKKFASEITLIRHMKVDHKDIIMKTVSQKLEI